MFGLWIFQCKYSCLSLTAWGDGLIMRLWLHASHDLQLKKQKVCSDEIKLWGEKMSAVWPFCWWWLLKVHTPSVSNLPKPKWPGKKSVWLAHSLDRRVVRFKFSVIHEDVNFKKTFNLLIVWCLFFFSLSLFFSQICFPSLPMWIQSLLWTTIIFRLDEHHLWLDQKTLPVTWTFSWPITRLCLPLNHF